MNNILNVPFSLPRDEIHKHLAVKPGSKSESALEELLDQVEKIAIPKALYRISYIEKRDLDGVTIEDVPFHSSAMSINFEKIGRVFPNIATCGKEVDEFLKDTKDMIQQYWLNAIKLTLLRISVAYLRQTIQDRYRIINLSAMNPGSGEVNVWPIEEQSNLFSLFGGVETVEKEIGVQLLPSYLMTPEMSTSGILFPSETSYSNCQLCQREVCPSRRAPFDADLWDTVQG